MVAAAYRNERSGAVRLWSLAGATPAQHGQQHDFAVESVAFSPRGDLFVTGDRGGMVRLWRTDGTAYAPPVSLHRRAVTAVAISPRGDLVASGARHEPLVVSDLNGRARTFETGIGDTMDVIVFSPTGNLIAAAGVPGFMQIWDLNGEVRVPPFKAHTESFYAIAFPPAGDYVATVGGGSTR
jgi:WD40 repeat protein